MSIVKTERTQDPQLASLVGNLGELIRQARQKVLRAVDTVQVQTCWQIGRHIVEFEQEGARRAVYGKQLLSTLAKVLTVEFGKGFDETNLRKMRLFYQAFPIRDALRLELSWTHYRRLLGFAFIARQQRISTEGRDFYIDLVFYNYLLNCFVIFDLKRGELTHQDVGQLDMYVRMYDDLKRKDTDGPTVGTVSYTHLTLPTTERV